MKLPKTLRAGHGGIELAEQPIKPRRDTIRLFGPNTQPMETQTDRELTDPVDGQNGNVQTQLGFIADASASIRKQYP